MAPSLIDEHYSKQLATLPLSKGGYAVLQTVHFVTSNFDIVRLKELQATNGEYDYLIVVELLPPHNESFQHDEIDRVINDEGKDIFAAADYFLTLKMNEEESAETIGRFAYNDFPFIEANGEQSTGKQIKGAFLKPPYDTAKIGTTVYLYLLQKYHHLVCDNMQTILGASMWSGTMRKFGDVMIYDTANACFVEQLGEKAVGMASGFIPWDVGSLAPSRIADEWGDRQLNFQKGSCTHIVNIISYK